MSLLKKLQIGNNEIGKYTQEYLLLDYQCHTCRQHNDFRPEADKFCELQDVRMCIFISGLFLRHLSLGEF